MAEQTTLTLIEWSKQRNIDEITTVALSKICDNPTKKRPANFWNQKLIDLQKETKAASLILEERMKQLNLSRSTSPYGYH